MLLTFGVACSLSQIMFRSLSKECLMLCFVLPVTLKSLIIIKKVFWELFGVEETWEGYNPSKIIKTYKF